LKSGVVDSSGVEMYYTMTPRPVEMGVFNVGGKFTIILKPQRASVIRESNQFWFFLQRSLGDSIRAGCG
jgi:hypothetical protein